MTKTPTMPPPPHIEGINVLEEGHTFSVVLFGSNPPPPTEDVYLSYLSLSLCSLCVKQIDRACQSMLMQEMCWIPFQWRGSKCGDLLLWSCSPCPPQCSPASVSWCKHTAPDNDNLDSIMFQLVFALLSSLRQWVHSHWFNAFSSFQLRILGTGSPDEY